MASADLQWRKAFALQALSDLEAREYLAETSAHPCHQLHFLQMASEKICKAYLIELGGYKNLKKRHDVIARTFPVVVRQVFSSDEAFHLKAGQKVAIKRMAHEIELLSPMCHATDTRPDNSEYPWLDGNGQVQTPCLHAFSSVFHDGRTMIQVIQVIRRAAKMYSD
jgi:hypothetical protein